MLIKQDPDTKCSFNQPSHLSLLNTIDWEQKQMRLAHSSDQSAHRNGARFHRYFCPGLTRVFAAIDFTMVGTGIHPLGVIWVPVNAHHHVIIVTNSLYQLPLVVHFHPLGILYPQGRRSWR